MCFHPRCDYCGDSHILIPWTDSWENQVTEENSCHPENTDCLLETPLELNNSFWAALATLCAASSHIHGSDRSSGHDSSHPHARCLTFTEPLPTHQLLCSFQRPVRWAAGRLTIPILQEKMSGRRPCLRSGLSQACDLPTRRAFFSGPLHLLKALCWQMCIYVTCCYLVSLKWPSLSSFNNLKFCSLFLRENRHALKKECGSEQSCFVDISVYFPVIL